MSITFGKRSTDNLVGVHPNLIAVAERAAQLATLEEDFFINEGVRSIERQKKLYAQGRTAPGPKVTWTLVSNHFKKPSTGYGHALDAYPYPFKDVNSKAYKAKQRKLIALFMRAADQLDIPIRSGADWDMDGNFGERGEGDSPHFELWGAEVTDDFRRPHFIIALLIVGLFAWAFGENTGDDTMKGALIGAFNLAIGFYLGSVVSRDKSVENTGKAFDAITAAQHSTPLAQDTDVIRPGDDVTINKAGDGHETDNSR